MFTFGLIVMSLMGKSNHYFEGNICRMAAPSGRSHSAMFACPITVRVIAQPPLLRLKWQILEKNLKFLSVFLAHYHHFVLSLPNKQAKTGCGLADATGKPCVLLSCCTVSATNALTSWSLLAQRLQTNVKEGRGGVHRKADFTHLRRCTSRTFRYGIYCTTNC